jgi:hypothetical protein
MDCEKFEQHLMDALYDELDELTHAAFKRHMDGCSRCSSAWNGLRATRDVGVLPLEEPSDGLEERILAAARAAQRKTPWHRKTLRVLAWAGSHAMRPQLAMAALFVLVIGSSLLLLRPKPASMPSPVRVTERGVPAPEPVQAQPDPAVPREPIPGMEPPPYPVAAAAPTAAAEGREEEQGKRKDGESKTSDAKTALAEARSVRQRAGCNEAVKAYDDVGARFPATVSAAEAMWEAADCYKAMGNGGKARELYESLRSFASYRDKAEAELADADASAVGNQAQMASRAAAGASPPAAAKASPKAAAKSQKQAQAAEAPAASPPNASPTSPGGVNPTGKAASPAPPRPSAADAYSY